MLSLVGCDRGSQTHLPTFSALQEMERVRTCSRPRITLHRFLQIWYKCKHPHVYNRARAFWYIGRSFAIFGGERVFGPPGTCFPAHSWVVSCWDVLYFEGVVCFVVVSVCPHHVTTLLRLLSFGDFSLSGCLCFGLPPLLYYFFICYWVFCLSGSRDW